MILIALQSVFLSFTWRVTEWGECRVDVLLSQQDRRRSNQTGLCGGGMQTREVYCILESFRTFSYPIDGRNGPGTKGSRVLDHVTLKLVTSSLTYGYKIPN